MNPLKATAVEIGLILFALLPITGAMVAIAGWIGLRAENNLSTVKLASMVVVGVSSQSAWLLVALSSYGGTIL